jgi:hypothetical protein
MLGNHYDTAFRFPSLWQNGINEKVTRLFGATLATGSLVGNIEPGVGWTNDRCSYRDESNC